MCNTRILFKMFQEMDAGPIPRNFVSSPIKLRRRRCEKDVKNFSSPLANRRIIIT